MTRTVTDVKIETRSARERLTPRDTPYWRAIDAGMHIGYRRGKKRGSWVARYRPEGGKYTKTVLGITDDVLEADNSTVLSFSQAQEKARIWFTDQVSITNGTGLKPGKYKIADVMEEYRQWYKVHRKGISQVNYVIDSHIIAELGLIDAAKLSPAHIRTFQEKLASTPARLRTRPGEEQRYSEAPQTEDGARKRKASANRVLNTLKAALNKAYQDGKIANDDAWRRVKPFRDANSPRIRYLNLDECQRLVKECDKNFASIVRAAILTGCRYGELSRLVCGDIDMAAGRLWVGISKSGKGRHVVLTDEAKGFFKIVTKGKADGDLLFTRTNGKAWGRSHQHRRLADACEKAKISPIISFHILRHTHASHLAMNNAPLAVIARQLGHSDSRMAEKHYAHLSNDYVSDTIRGSFPNMGIGGRVKGS